MNGKRLMVNAVTRYLFFVVLSVGTCAVSMESKRIDQLVAVLPQLTTLEKWAVHHDITGNSSNVIELLKEEAYKAALTSEDPIAQLKDVAKPYAFEVLVQSLPERGKTMNGLGKQQYPLAHLARALLLQQQGVYQEAEKAFEEALSATGHYRSHEEPIACTAQCMLLLGKGEYESAFQKLVRLQTLCKAYESFKPVARIERQMLMDAHYVPAIVQCAQEGSTDVWQQLPTLGKTNTLRDRCYVAQLELAHKNKKMRSQGSSTLQALIKEYLKTENPELKALLEEFGLVTALEGLAQNNHQGAAGTYAQLKCHQVLAMDGACIVSTDAKPLFQHIKKFASAGKSQEGTQPDQLDAIIRYADALLAYHDVQLAQAARACIGIVQSKSKNSLQGKMRVHARAVLDDLIAKKQIDACSWHAQELVKNEGKKISVETAQFCCTLAQHFLDQEPSAQLNHESGTRMLQALGLVADSGNAQASYLLSRCSLRRAHVGHEANGLPSDQNEQLKTAFIYAVNAQKAGVEEAASLVKALMLYRGAQGLLIAKKDDLAVEQLLQLLDVQLPEAEKKLCVAFARHTLYEKAYETHPIAGAWYIAEILEDDKERAAALMVCQQTVTGLLTLDMFNKTNERWKNGLSPLQRFNVFAKVERIATESASVQEQAQACYVMSQCYLLQALIDYPFLATTKLPNTQLLETSLSYAKKACERIRRDTQDSVAKLYREQLGKVYYEFGYYHLERNNTQQATELYAEGSRICHPACMRALTGMVLELPCSNEKIDKKMFDTQIATLERAYELGDAAAGVILAEHYFDGPSNFFACGYDLKKDLKKAITYAQAIGPVYAPTKRILGYVEFLKLLQTYKGNGKKPDISYGALLVMQSILEGQEKGYGALQEMWLSPCCDQKLSQKITNFMVNQADKKDPAALCAVGSMYLRDTDLKNLQKSIAYFEEAVKISKGTYGHYELAKLYAQLERDGVREVFKSAQHCIWMLEADVQKNAAPIEHSQITAKVLELLYAYDGPAELKNQAQEQIERITTYLKSVGVEIVISTSKHDDQLEAASNGNALNEVDIEALLFKALKIENVDHAQEAMVVLADKLVSQIADKSDLIAKMKQSADQGNPFAQFVMSKIFGEHAKRGVDGRAKSILLVEAVASAGKAWTRDRGNKEYSGQFGIAYLQLFTHYTAIVQAESVLDAEELADILLLIEHGLQELPQLKLHPEMCDTIQKKALECLQALASKGCAQAVTMYNAVELNQKKK